MASCDLEGVTVVTVVGEVTVSYLVMKMYFLIVVASPGPIALVYSSQRPYCYLFPFRDDNI